MQGEIRIIDLNDPDGALVAPEWLARAEPVHRQLRPRLSGDYPAQMRRVFAGGGRMCVVALGDAVVGQEVRPRWTGPAAGPPVGVAVYRVYENTSSGVHLYVDDLVTDEARRSTGVGHALMEHLRALARAEGCRALTLDSGTQRERAHAFYFRERMTIVAFHFHEALA